jgi:tRNA pseudouridine55 synthase
LDKAYRAVVKLGEATETGDGEGDVVEALPVPDISWESMEEALEPFRGTIAQRAPLYSAVKVGGEPLYARARRGEEVEAPTRDVTIRTLQLESLEADRLTLFIECSKGTYIRSLAHDVGRHLGCGAHCLSLERTRVGPFTLAEATPLEELERVGPEAARERLMRLDEALAHFMEPIGLTVQGASIIIHGGSVDEDSILSLPGTVQAGAAYRALDEEGRLVAIVEAQREAQCYRWAPRRVIARG